MDEGSLCTSGPYYGKVILIIQRIFASAAHGCGMILILAGLCLFILLGGAEPEAGTPFMSTAIEIVTPENIE